MSQRVYLFDTTLRDGEQSPGASLNVDEKIQIARQLAKLGVDIIEAGFPISSPGDFEAVRTIAREVKGVAVAGLARTHFEDIDRAWEAVRHAEQARIHTFISTSDIHLEHQLRMTREQVLEAAVAAVKRAKSYTADVEFSTMDASRSDLDYLCQVLAAAIKAGATVVNIPDTVGYAVPEEWGKFIDTICHKVEGIEKVIVSVHCHNDLGLAVANSLAAVMNGARQVEGTINGIGERAGNAALEELVMTLRTRKDLFSLYTGVHTEEIYRTSRLVSNLTGMKVQANKAVVGKNAFAHESGIHQDGVIKERTTYEIMSPAMVGISKSNLVLGKLSGRHAFRQRLEELGYNLSSEELKNAFARFKKLADKKRDITDDDLEAIIEEEIRKAPHTYTLNYLHISSGTTVVPTATVVLQRDGQRLEEAACGNGPVDAICKAVDKITGMSCTMVNWGINAITSGKDALGDVTLKITMDGQKVYVGRGISTDILDASAKAYVNAVNKLVWDNRPVEKIDIE
ncbi:MAG: 2-isopropylmalate synthase [Pelotomaculum sp. PtaB.Bin013]|uniref:2-isopropylmalate synthase n=1 Tax=Pelotomaculum isophthalicicum JI TaxID=947010 RepID=A0A9X4H481_9FIRM|nr:2-isopropylmalate synthase [Pelotomaculum isophthalicicum]MDF9408538.1 2-isopropylmalate synthase [Pelotomaculum isophthalicicum JI]OPX82372.1 MAG: 2-isopropylmalate synthase [Pelotomaculum sp. PtaB.Bin013]